MCDIGRRSEKCSSTSDIRLTRKFNKANYDVLYSNLKSFNWEREMSNLNGYDSSDLSNLNDIAINKLFSDFG